MPFFNRTPKIPQRGGGRFRPLLYIVCALLFAYVLFSDEGVLAAPSALEGYRLEPGAADGFLRHETGSWVLPEMSWTALLEIESALMRYLPLSLPAESTPEASAAVSPPVMTPQLSPPPSAWPSPSAPSAAENTPTPAPDISLSDDRVLREITLLPQSGGEYLTDGSVVITNDTKNSVDVDALLSQKTVLKKASSKKPQILIVHTHGSESYLPDSQNSYTPTDTERTNDTRYNVVRLGDEMEKMFTDMGLSVIHDRHVHDYPTYANSYTRSLECITQYIKDYPSIQIVLDVHRDSISTQDGSIYKVVSETEKGKVAQMMFVVGSNGTGLPHDNWRQNLSVAVKLQEKLLQYSPTLMRPIHLRVERFNQHATPASLILEIGTAGNSLSEALASTEIFCQTAGPYFKDCMRLS